MQVYGPYNPEITVYGTNANGFTGYSNPGCYVYENQIQVWYQIFPTPAVQMNITTCNSATDFDTVITVYEGNECSNLLCSQRSDDKCTAYNVDASTVQFVPTATSYFVAIGGANANVKGTFAVSFSQ